MSEGMVARIERPAPGHYQGRLSAVLDNRPAGAAARAGWSHQPPPQPHQQDREAPARRRSIRHAQLALPIGPV